MNAEEYLNQIPMWTREKNSLEDVRRFLDYLGNPDRTLPVLHVAGTNGKGSVCAYLTSGLAEAGYRTGTFVSPHLVEIRERFLINGQAVNNEELEECFNQVKDAARKMMGRGLHHPTFFEFLFYMAVLYFSGQQVDFAVMETGLGGRLDTTNVIEHPLISVITSISLEHTRYLGNTIPEIAKEKAGIIKTDVPVVFDGSCKEAEEVIKKQALCRNSPCFPVKPGDFILTGTSGSGYQVEWEDGTKLQIPFPAAYQAENGALAWKAFQVLMDKGAIGRTKEPLLKKGMEKTRWPGRMEEVRPGFFLDGAHNPAGIHAFAQAARAIVKGHTGKILLLFAAVEDKDYQEMVRTLCQALRPDLTAAVQMKNDRSLSAKALSGLFAREGCQALCFEETKDALAFLLKEKRVQDYLFCAGSLYLVGEVKGLLAKEMP